MANEKQRLVSADPDLRIDTELEADPMLRWSEGKASPLRIAVVAFAAIVIVAAVAWGVSQP